MQKHSVAELRKFVAPEIIAGKDARLLIGRYISHYGTKKPMIVTDRNIGNQPWFSEILHEVEKAVRDYTVFDAVSSNPKDFEAMMGAELFLTHDCDLVIAVGGGSPMDCAKCISIVATNGGNILDYEGVDEINLPGPPLICIPSTAGTSADVSQFAIICDTAASVKKAIISKKVVPDLALIDPVVLMTMDSYLTACTGMDALTHAIEAYVSNAQSPLTDVHALEAIQLIQENIENAVEDGRTLFTMNQMMLGSLHAGLAFSNASLGAVHAMAHSLGGLLELPHGECNSILLEHVVELNYSAAPDRFRRIGIQMGLKADLSDGAMKEHILARIETIRSNTGIPSHVEGEAMEKDKLDRLVENAMLDPCMVTNPRKLGSEEVRGIYERILRIKK